MRSLAIALAMFAVQPAVGRFNDNTQQPDARIFLGLRQSVATPGLAYDFLTLFADGRVLNGIPAEGLAIEPDWEQECKNTPCGTIGDRGREMYIRWNYGEEQVLNIDNSGVLRLDGRNYRPLALLDGLRLDGLYEGPGTGSNAAASIEFTPDGRFAERGLMGYTQWAILANTAERERVAVPGGAGRYSIRRNTLELKYDQGSVARFIIFAPVGTQPGTTPGAVFLNRTRLERAP